MSVRRFPVQDVNDTWGRDENLSCDFCDVRVGSRPDWWYHNVWACPEHELLARRVIELERAARELPQA